MKKYKVELLAILILSLLSSVLLPNFLKLTATIVIPPITELLPWFVSLCILFSILFFSLKPKEKSKIIYDGYVELYNQKNQITKKGFFQGGTLYTGSKYIYKKDAMLSHIEIYKNGNIIEELGISSKA